MYTCNEIAQVVSGLSKSTGGSLGQLNSLNNLTLSSIQHEPPNVLESGCTSIPRELWRIIDFIYRYAMGKEKYQLLF